MNSLVDAEWLAVHVDDPDLVVLDCRVVIDFGSAGMSTSSGRGPFDDGHISGAAFADLTDDLSEPDQPIGFALPSPEAFCAAMGRLGVGDGSRVVLYDTSGSMSAARVWWMLRWVGRTDRSASVNRPGCRTSHRVGRRSARSARHRAR